MAHCSGGRAWLVLPGRASGLKAQGSGLQERIQLMSEESKNLTLPRSEKSVWDNPSFSARLSTYDRERWMAVAFGSALAMAGARRGGFPGALLGALGAALSIRAAMGFRDLGVARDYLDRRLQDTGWGGRGLA